MSFRRMSKGWINFERISAAALAASPELLKKWFPRGRVVGRESQVGNLQGDPGDSLKVNLTSGKWADFAADDTSGDLVALYAAIHRLDQATAARTLANELGIANDTAGRHGSNAHRTDQWRSILAPATIRKLVLFTDADAKDQGKAQKAIHKAAWLQERVRRTVVIAKPPAGQDFNDVLRAADG